MEKTLNTGIQDSLRNHKRKHRKMADSFAIKTTGLSEVTADKQWKTSINGSIWDRYEINITNINLVSTARKQMKISLLGAKEVYTFFGKKPLSPKVRKLQACVLDKRHCYCAWRSNILRGFCSSINNIGTHTDYQENYHKATDWNTRMSNSPEQESVSNQGSSTWSLQMSLKWCLKTSFLLSLF